MFNWFRKRKEPIPFPDNQAAFAHACTLGYQPLIGALIPALVLEAGGFGPDGERTFQINLAVDGVGRAVWSSTLKDAKGFPKEGDFVGFRIVMIASDLPEHANLIGYLACRLEPVLVPGKGWRTAQIYTPDNLKPALRF